MIDIGFGTPLGGEALSVLASNVALIGFVLLCLVITGFTYIRRGNLPLYIIATLAWFGLGMFCITATGSIIFGGVAFSLALACAFWGLADVAKSMQRPEEEDGYVARLRRRSRRPH